MKKAQSNPIVDAVLRPADLKALDNTVKALGDCSGRLTPEEKASATDIVDQWAETMDKNIRANAYAAEGILVFLEGKPMHGDFADNHIRLFREVLGETPEFLAYEAALEHSCEIRRNAPDSETPGSGATLSQANVMKAKNRAAVLRWRREAAEADAACARTVKAYIMSVKDLDVVKDATSKLRTYSRKANAMAKDCASKAAEAKLNISVSDGKARELLRELASTAGLF